MKQTTKQRTGRILRAAARVPVASLCLTLAGWALATCLTPGAGTALAQNTNATIRGQVLDPSGALVPGAKVIIVNQETGVSVFSGTTDPSGAFVAPQVIPGTYKITVNAPGLKQTVLNNVAATVAQVAAVNINMEVGAVDEVVTVSSKGEELDRSTSNISTLITPTDVQNLPVLGRNTENLLMFVPGAAHGGAANSPSTSQLSINGSRTLNTEVLLNGVSTIVASTGSPLTLPSPDGVDSFRVLTTNAPAQYGRTSGAVISVNTISGTNVYHGNVYFLMRNEDMDANSYFNKLTIVNGAPTPRAKDRFFQMGGSLGGPVRLPWLYNGKDKTFFFVNYDRTLQPTTSVLNLTVPTAAQRTGDLSAALATTDANGKARTPQQVYQPTGTTSPIFGNNQIGPIDPAAAKILALLPLPNTTGTYDAANNRYTGNWTSQQNFRADTTRVVGRLDEQITQKDRLSLNVYRYISQSPNPIYYNVPLLNSTWDCSCSNAWLPSVDYTRTWTPTLVMDLNMGFFRNVVLRNPPGAGLNAAQQLGIASLPLDQTPELTFGSGAISNIGADTNTNQVNITNTFTPFGSVTKTWGPHSMMFGASLRKNQFNSYNPSGSPEGMFNFDGSITNHGTAGNATTALADFLLGKVKTGNYQIPMPPTGRRNYNLGVFAQDDWKVSPKLTLNLGLRWEYESPLVISNNVYTRFDPTTGQLLAAGINASRSLNIKTPKLDFSPRIGLAYSIDDKTVFRAAFGTFYGTIFQNLGGQVAFPGYDVTTNYNNLGTGVAQPFSLSQGFPLTGVRDLSNPFAALAGASDSSPFGISGVSFNDFHKMSMVQQWNAGIQRRLPLALTLEVNYVGNHALHLPYNIPANFVPLSQADAVTLANTTKASQDAKPFPTIGSFTVVNNVGSSNYNSLQVTVKRDFNRSLALLSNYTYAKAMDDGSTIYNFSAPNGTANAQYTADPVYRARDYAVSNIDVKHTFNLGVVYKTPGPKWVSGWVISPVFVGHTGLPINITQSNEIPNVSQQRPNGDTSHLKLDQPFITGNALQYFQPSSADNTAFPLTASGPVYGTVGGVRTRLVSTGFGNVPRDSVRAPGEVSFDASVSKNFPIYKRVTFQIRADAFNVINHTNFGSPNGSLTVTVTQPTTPPGAAPIVDFRNSSSFGRITSTQPPRRLQVSGRFRF